MKMMKWHRFCRLITFLAALGSPVLQAQAQTYTNFTTIDEPLAGTGSSYGTYVEGISSNIVVGYYYNTEGRHGFYHTLGTTNYTTLDDPASISSVSTNTAAYGISGGNIVGYYGDEKGFSGTYGFIYNIATGSYASLDDPSGVNSGESSTEAFGIDGTNIVGSESDHSLPAGSVFGFLCTPVAGQSDAYSFASFYIPVPDRIETAGGVSSTNYDTLPYGISGENVVGTFADTSDYSHGFVYNLDTKNLTLLTSPGGGYIWAHGIDGNQVVGYFANPAENYNDSGFLCTIGSTNLTALVDPLGPSGTFAQGISDGLIVGYYYDNNSAVHGFVVGTSSALPALPVIKTFQLSGNKYILSGISGEANAHYYLLASTNIGLPLPLWTIIATNSFDGSGNFVFSNTVSPTAPRTFYRLQELP